MAIVHLDLIELHGTLIDFDGAFFLQHQFFLIVQGLLRNCFARPRFAIAVQIHLCLGQQILIPLQRALGLQQIRLVRAGIDIDQRVAFADDLTFPVVHRGDNSVHLAGDRTGIDRRDGSDRIEVETNIAFRGGGGRQRDWSAASSCRARGLCGVLFVAQNQRESRPKNQQDNNPNHDSDAGALTTSRDVLLIFWPTHGTCVLISRQVDSSLA